MVDITGIAEDEPEPTGEELVLDTIDPVPIVCLGASAGGLEALQGFFSSLPSDTGAAFVTIVHLSPDFKSLMSELIARHTGMRAIPAAQDMVLAANTIYFIPPGKKVVLKDGRLDLTDQDRSPGHSLNLPIDAFLRSLADAAGESSTAVILSGTGSDGSRGICALKDAGGIVLAQDPESASFDGMPRGAIETGVVDASGDPAKLAGIVSDILRRNVPFAALSDEADGGDQLEVILKALRLHFGLDLSYLRPSMMLRRVRRRMAVLGLDGVAQYGERLGTDRNEAVALRQDMFIGVTGFFRDERAFDYLKRHLINDLLHRESDQPLRVWVPACASGEEVYSIAILIAEAMESTGQTRGVKIFATDVDATALARTNRATYSASSVADISHARLGRFFVGNGPTFSVQPSIREMVICAKHNVVTDPPFTRIDLVSCRNFLIYLDQAAQEQVLAGIHFALQERGALLLGSAEALGRLEAEFTPLSSRHKLFEKATSGIHPAMRQRGSQRDPTKGATRERHVWRESAEATLRQVLDAVFEDAECSAAVASMHGLLLEVIGDPLDVFHVPKGKPTQDLIRIVSEELTIPLMTGMKRLREGDTTLRYAVELDGPPKMSASVRLRKLAATRNVAERVLFIVEPSNSVAETTRGEPIALDATTERLRDLQTELLHTRETLQSTIEELQSANEEQQGTNEELVASNEELQSTNEELQSVNEELFKVNEDHQGKIEELAILAADLDNLLHNIDVGTLFLDSAMRIRRFTPPVTQVMNLIEHDIGRSVEDFAHNLGDGFIDAIRKVIRDGDSIERDVRAAGGGWSMVTLRPYEDHSGARSGAVLTFVDVTAMRNAREMARVANAQLNVANAELGKRQDELEELFGIVAHDMKRPLIAMDGLLKIVIERIGQSGAGDVGALVAKALDECGRMKRMLDDLANISELSHTDFVVEEVEVQSWIDGIVSRVRESVRPRGIQINCASDSGIVRLPTTALEQTVVNLLENAVNYGCTNEGPRIDVLCQVTQGSLELSVRDNGKGIAPSDHQKVFEPFRRLDPDLALGSGVGLVAVRRLISRLGGNVTLFSEKDQGAKFVVRIPVKLVREPAATSATRLRVLVVEDDALDAKAITRYLGDDYVTTRAMDLSRATACLEQDSYDVVLLDLALPDGHGFELVHHVRAKLRKNTPIIVITGHGAGIPPNSMSATIAGLLPKEQLTRETLRAAVAGALETIGAGA
jgi:two-component system CheB/CheR fusion protein